MSSCRRALPQHHTGKWKTKYRGFSIAPAFHLWQSALALEISYELTQKDFTESFTAHRHRRSAFKWIRGVVFWVTILGLAFLLFGAIRTGNTRTLMPLFILATLLLLILGGLPLSISARRQFLKSSPELMAREKYYSMLQVHTRDGTVAPAMLHGRTTFGRWRAQIRYFSIPLLPALIFFQSAQ